MMLALLLLLPPEEDQMIVQQRRLWQVENTDNGNVAIRVATGLKFLPLVKHTGGTAQG